MREAWDVCTGENLYGCAKNLYPVAAQHTSRRVQGGSHEAIYVHLIYVSRGRCEFESDERLEICGENLSRLQLLYTPMHQKLFSYTYIRYFNIEHYLFDRPQ